MKTGTYKQNERGVYVRDERGRFSSFFNSLFIVKWTKRKVKQFVDWFISFWERRLVTPLAWIGLLMLMGGSFYLGTLQIDTAEAESFTPTFKKEVAPILKRIAKCESGGKHFDKNGQVLMRSNTNKSVDVGAYQLNTVWFKKATEMGLDITKEKDNEKMAIWIYENRGTGDWYSSAKCWQK